MTSAEQREHASRLRTGRAMTVTWFADLETGMGAASALSPELRDALTIATQPIAWEAAERARLAAEEARLAQEEARLRQERQAADALEQERRRAEGVRRAAEHRAAQERRRDQIARRRQLGAVIGAFGGLGLALLIVLIIVINVNGVDGVGRNYGWALLAMFPLPIILFLVGGKFGGWAGPRTVPPDPTDRP